MSLVTLVVGLAVMSAGMKNYPVKWEGAVKAGKQMANAIVEYIQYTAIHAWHRAAHRDLKPALWQTGNLLKYFHKWGFKW